MSTTALPGRLLARPLLWRVDPHAPMKPALAPLEARAATVLA